MSDRSEVMGTSGFEEKSSIQQLEQLLSEKLPEQGYPSTSPEHAALAGYLRELASNRGTDLSPSDILNALVELQEIITATKAEILELKRTSGEKPNFETNSDER